VFTARYALSPYIKQIRFVFKGLNYSNREVIGVAIAYININIKRLVFITEVESVYSAVRTESLYKTDTLRL
jgi:hypothetical protein